MVTSIERNGITCKYGTYLVNEKKVDRVNVCMKTIHLIIIIIPVAILQFLKRKTIMTCYKKCMFAREKHFVKDFIDFSL